jgi:hypothetical protein
MRVGRSIYDATLLVGFQLSAAESSAPYLANKSAITLLLKPFNQLGFAQLQRICSLHDETLTRWLSDSDAEAGGMADDQARGGDFPALGMSGGASRRRPSAAGSYASTAGIHGSMDSIDGNTSFPVSFLR